ncbi:MAG: sulfatase, partial [Pseudomonadota bacterium]
IDLMPTLAEAAGVALPDDRIINGRSLLGAATGAGVVEREDDALFWKSGAYNVVRSGDWKLHLDARQDKTWLFDLAKDPAERTNLADNRPEKVAELSALIEAHLARRTTGPLYPHGLVSPIPLDKTQGADPEPGDEYVMWFN